MEVHCSQIVKVQTQFVFVFPKCTFKFINGRVQPQVIQDVGVYGFIRIGEM